MKRRPPAKVFTVRWQWLVQPLQMACRAVWENAFSASADMIWLPFSFMAESAAPYAPISPAMAGRTTSQPVSISKARNTASLRNVPPCTTMFSPSSLGELARMTL